MLQAPFILPHDFLLILVDAPSVLIVWTNSLSWLPAIAGLLTGLHPPRLTQQGTLLFHQPIVSRTIHLAWKVLCSSECPHRNGGMHSVPMQSNHKTKRGEVGRLGRISLESTVSVVKSQ